MLVRVASTDRTSDAAAEIETRRAYARRRRDAETMDRRRREYEEHWAFISLKLRMRRASMTCGKGARRARPRAASGGRAQHADPRVSFDIKSAADACGGDAFLKDGAPGATSASWIACWLAALRRADGGRLARHLALRGQLRLSGRSRARRVAVARLGDSRVQWKPAVRPIITGSSRRSPPKPTDEQVLAPLLTGTPAGKRRRQRGKRNIASSMWLTRADIFHGVSRAHLRVRALPRSQVRSAHAEGVYQFFSMFQKHRRGRTVFVFHATPPTLRADARGCTAKQRLADLGRAAVEKRENSPRCATRRKSIRRMAPIPSHDGEPVWRNCGFRFRELEGGKFGTG